MRFARPAVSLVVLILSLGACGPEGSAGQTGGGSATAGGSSGGLVLGGGSTIAGGAATAGGTAGGSVAGGVSAGGGSVAGGSVAGGSSAGGSVAGGASGGGRSAGGRAGGAAAGGRAGGSAGGSTSGGAAGGTVSSDGGVAAWTTALQQLQPGQWLRFPAGQTLDAVKPTPVPNGYFPYITVAWNGGVVDTTRSILYIFGGGHNDYWGNEVYCLALTTGRVTRCWGPGAYQSSNSTASLSDGTPTSRHTYDLLVYLPPPFDQFLTAGGSVSPVGFGPTGTWTARLPFSPGTNPWTLHPNQGATVFQPNYGDFLEYDPVTERVYGGMTSDWKAWNPRDAGVTEMPARSPSLGYHLTSAIDPVRRKIFLAGDDAWAGPRNLAVLTLPPSSTQLGQAGAQTGLTVTGCTTSPSIDAALAAGSPGMAYVPAIDRLVLWSGESAVFAVHPDTGACTRLDTGAGPTFMAFEQGTFGKWGYAPALGLMVLQGPVTEPPWVFKVH